MSTTRYLAALLATALSFAAIGYFLVPSRSAKPPASEPSPVASPRPTKNLGSRKLSGEFKPAPASPVPEGFDPDDWKAGWDQLQEGKKSRREAAAWQEKMSHYAPHPFQPKPLAAVTVMLGCTPEQQTTIENLEKQQNLDFQRKTKALADASDRDPETYARYLALGNRLALNFPETDRGPDFQPGPEESAILQRRTDLLKELIGEDLHKEFVEKMGDYYPHAQKLENFPNAPSDYHNQDYFLNQVREVLNPDQREQFDAYIHHRRENGPNGHVDIKIEALDKRVLLHDEQFWNVAQLYETTLSPTEEQLAEVLDPYQMELLKDLEPKK